MKSTQINILEKQAAEFRQRLGLSNLEAIKIKSLLLKLKILTVFRPLSEDFSGMSLQCGEYRFMLINSNHSKGRQHFTIAHELYHLYFDSNPMPHMPATGEKKDESEQCADAFALLFLMPADGIRQLIPETELQAGKLTLASILRIELYFSVSHTAAINRLCDLKLIPRKQRDYYLKLPVKRTAFEYGYDRSLYLPGNENLVIGDFGEKARALYEAGKISEGHYLELLHKLSIDENEV